MAGIPVLPTAANTHPPIPGYGASLAASRTDPARATAHLMALGGRAEFDAAGPTLDIKFATQGFVVDPAATARWTAGSGPWQPETPTSMQALMRLENAAFQGSAFYSSIVTGGSFAEHAVLSSSMVFGFSNLLNDPAEANIA